MDRPSFALSACPAATELKIISRTDDLRLCSGNAPWSFVQPGGKSLAAQRRLCVALSVLLVLATGVIALASLRAASHDTLLQGLPVLACTATLLLGYAWNYRLERRNRRDGELAATAIRKEMARAPANDWLFAVVYSDLGAYLELLAFFQEGGGAQRMETIRAPRTSDGSKHTETDIRVIRQMLETHFSVGEINDLNVVSIASLGRPIETEQPVQHRA